MEEKNIILVDIFDRKIDMTTKHEAHKSGKLHRAFSVFIYHDDKMLIQRRAFSKYHSGGLWSNACCSHPSDDLDLVDCVKNRMYEEIGISCPVEEIFQFTYFHKFNDGLYEYEYDHVFIGEYNGDILLNPMEAIEAKWINFKELENLLIAHPEIFSVWFLIAAPKVLRVIKNCPCPL